MSPNPLSHPVSALGISLLLFTSSSGVLGQEPSLGESTESELDETVVDAADPAPEPEPITQPAPVTTAPPPPAPEPEPVIIDDEAPYVPDVPVSANRNDIPVLESSRSTTVFTEDFIEDLNVVRVRDLVTRSAGVTLQDTGEGRDMNLSIRGFDATILRNGFSGVQFGANGDVEPYSLERVEVLKGSDSIAYGDTTPGGFVNLVSKRPLGYDHGEIGVEFGSFNAVSPRFDIGGRIGGAPAGGGTVVIDDENPYYSSKAPYAKMPVGEGHPSLDYRIVGLYDYHESYKDYDKPSHRFYIAPSVRYNFSDTTSLTIYTEILQDRTYQDYGIPLDRFGNFVAPRDFIINHPNDFLEREDRVFGYDFVHEINDAWTFEQRGVYQFANYNYSDLALPVAYNDTTRTVTRTPAEQEQDGDYYAMQFNLSGDFSIGNMRNRLYTGVDISQLETDGYTTFDFPAVILPLNVDNPVYQPDPNSVTPFPPFINRTQRQGFWVQDHLNLTDQFILSGGLRFDRVDQDTGAGSVIYEEWSPQAGAVYRITDSVSTFGNYSESFQPSQAFDRFGNVLDPETAQGHEVGMKYLSPDNRLSATVAYFDITRQNVPTADPFNPFTSIATGEQNAEGFEFEVLGEVFRNFTVQASYAHTNAIVTDDNTIPIGNDLEGVPEDTASFWGRYDLEGGRLDGFGVGAGLRYVGERPGGNFNTVFIDSYTVAQLGLFYEKDDWEFSVFVENLNDERALESVFGVESTGVGSARGNFEIAPTQVVAKITKKF